MARNSFGRNLGSGAPGREHGFRVREPVGEAEDFGGLEVSELYCPRCKLSMKTRKRLLLVLPEGDKHEYICSRCSTPLASKIEAHATQVKLTIS